MGPGLKPAPTFLPDCAQELRTHASTAPARYGSIAASYQTGTAERLLVLSPVRSLLGRCTPPALALPRKPGEGRVGGANAGVTAIQHGANWEGTMKPKASVLTI